MEDVDLKRRLLVAAAGIAAALPFTRIRTASAQAASASTPDTIRGTHTSFGTIKQIEAGDLNIGYADVGPADGKPVVLLHGWPYDIHCYVDVAPQLAKAGYRVIVPYVRGYGSTKFLSDSTMRNGQQGAVAADVIALIRCLCPQNLRRGRLHRGVRRGDLDRRRLRNVDLAGAGGADRSHLWFGPVGAAE